jgi:hypothetical protein
MANAKKPKAVSGKNLVVVRTAYAGVHVGELVAVNGQHVSLKNARRLWSWKGANTLNEVAMSGVASGSRVSEPVTSVELLTAIEVIPVAKDAVASLTRSAW